VWVERKTQDTIIMKEKDQHFSKFDRSKNLVFDTYSNRENFVLSIIVSCFDFLLSFP
jgi:hypothetical protein